MQTWCTVVSINGQLLYWAGNVTYKEGLSISRFLGEHGFCMQNFNPIWFGRPMAWRVFLATLATLATLPGPELF